MVRTTVSKCYLCSGSHQCTGRVRHVTEWDALLLTRLVYGASVSFPDSPRICLRSCPSPYILQWLHDLRHLKLQQMSDKRNWTPFSQAPLVLQADLLRVPSVPKQNGALPLTKMTIEDVHVYPLRRKAVRAATQVLFTLRLKSLLSPIARTTYLSPHPQKAAFEGRNEPERKV